MCVKISSHDKTLTKSTKVMVRVEWGVMVGVGGRAYFIEQGRHGRFH